MLPTVQLLLLASAAVLAVTGDDANTTLTTEATSTTETTPTDTTSETTPTDATTETTPTDTTTETTPTIETTAKTTTGPSQDSTSTAVPADKKPFPLPSDCFVLCPEGPDITPVCGTDKRVYDSECHLMATNCRNNVTVGDWEDCRGLHPLCPTNCLHIYDPVCGQDGKIYPNLCVMHSNNCGKTVRLEDLQYCLSKAREFRDYQPCPRQCQDVYVPVCSSTGQVYTNECYMRLYTCGQEAKIVEMQNCVKTPQCPAACTPIYDPVCGSDGRIYLNHCRFSQENCGKQTEKMPRSFCEGKMLANQTESP